MKKKIINGILLGAMLVASSSAFVSCKDNDADVKSELTSQYNTLAQQLQALQTQVNGIKSCTCDATLASRVADLESAIAALPNMNDYVKVADLPAKVQELLVNYYTKTEIDQLLADYAKRNEIPSLDGYLTQQQIEALLAEYAKTDQIPSLANYLTQDQIVELLSGYAQTSQIPSLDNYLTKQQIEALLEGYAKKDEITPGGITKEEVENIIKEELSDTKTYVTVLYGTMITSITADQVSNPVYDFSTPLNVKTNFLIACYGDAKKDIYFPTPWGAENVVEAGNKIINEENNAGAIYVTINPSSVNFAGKELKLVNTAGKEAPVKLSKLVESNKVLSFTTRGENAFYETKATVAAEDLEAISFNYMPEDMSALKSSIKTFLKERNKHNLATLAENIINIFYGNSIPAYRLQATWGDNYNTYSAANLAAIAIKPLTYDFDLNTSAEYEGGAINALERLENHIICTGTKNLNTRAKIWRWVNKFNQLVAAPILNNVNNAVQPTMLISGEDAIYHMHTTEVGENIVKAGKVTLHPTSWTAEIVAPAFKKLVAVTSVNGVEVAKDDAVNAGQLGDIVDGSVNSIPFTVEAGKTYKLVYTAMDYSGLTRTLTYTIKGE